VVELKADGEDEGEDKLNKRFGVVQQRKVGRLIVEVDGEGTVLACRFGGVSHVSSPVQMRLVRMRHGEGNMLSYQGSDERRRASPLNSGESGNSYTLKLKSYGAAKREILPGVEHRQSRYLNNRCENSHRPTRQREYRMQGFTSAGHAQRFLAAYGPIAQHFRPRRHLLSASAYRAEMRQRFASWAEITGTERAA